MCLSLLPPDLGFHIEEVGAAYGDKLWFCEMDLIKAGVIFVLTLRPSVCSLRSWALPTSPRCLDPESRARWWAQKASALGLICPQPRDSAGTNSPLSTPVNPCSLHHFLGNLWCILRHQKWDNTFVECEITTMHCGNIAQGLRKEQDCSLEIKALHCFLPEFLFQVLPGSVEALFKNIA